MKTLLTLFALVLTVPVRAQHNPGTDCLSCHPTWSAGGTVYADSTGGATVPGVPLQLRQADGVTLTLDASNAAGNIAAPLVPSGSYIVAMGPVTSRTWHEFPGQGSCNTCHVPGGNGSQVRTKRFPPLHTLIPPDNRCTHCHHYPATMAYDELRTPGVLQTAAVPPPVQGSRVEIAGGARSALEADNTSIRQVHHRHAVRASCTGPHHLIRQVRDGGNRGRNRSTGPAEPGLPYRPYWRSRARIS